MPIYELAADRIRAFSETSFDVAGIRERGDLQRLLRGQIEVIAPDVLIIAEEFCEWDDSRRRIDLLGLDKDANIVVFELKRTEDGGHMELQAVRYAAMVSAMTFEKAVEVYAEYLGRIGSGLDAKTSILEFLEWEEPDDDHFAQDVRIVLVSADFSKELTTAVLWLNERDLDIRCVRMKPYADNGRVLVDVQQVIPLLEAADYIVKITEKKDRERHARRERSETEKVLLRFWGQLLQKAKAKTELHSGISPLAQYWVGTGAGRTGLALNYAIGRKFIRVELYMDTGDKDTNKRLFDKLALAKAKIESAFGGPLGWERLDDKRACRVKAEFDGSVLDETNWDQLQDRMIDTMIRFEQALRPELDQLG